MTSFSNRLAQAARLETPFIAAFNKQCQTHRIFKFGIESTELRHLHEYIRSATDETSQFIRYLPDSALVLTTVQAGAVSRQTTLLEFKVQDQLVEYDSFFGRIQAEHMQRNRDNPPLQDKQDIFSVEKATLDLYQRLAEIGVVVVVVAWQTKRTIDPHAMRAQYADKVITCQVQDPSTELRTTGSGTVISNVHFSEFVPIGEFFPKDLGIPGEIIDAVVSEVTENS